MNLSLLQLLITIVASTILLSVAFLVIASIITVLLTLLRLPQDLNDIEITAPSRFKPKDKESK